MRVLLIGATGMLGQGVLRECLLSDQVEFVQTIGRTAITISHPKLRSVLHDDLADPSDIESQLSGFDACFFCLGVSAAGLNEAEYSRLTYDLTLGFAKTLVRINPAMTFIYISGSGTDSTEKGMNMWARVKGKTENALLRLGFKQVYLFRPGIIQPLHGAVSKTRFYRLFYTFFAPLLPLSRKIFPHHVLSTEVIAQAMLAAAQHQSPVTVRESPDIYRLAKLYGTDGKP